MEDNGWPTPVIVTLEWADNGRIHRTVEAPGETWDDEIRLTELLMLMGNSGRLIGGLGEQPMFVIRWE